jgi:xylulokinase
MNYILAHDMGTTGDKATLIEAESGSAAAVTFEPYATAYERPNWAEQNPEDWRCAVFTATRRLLAESGVSPSSIAVVSFSGHMQGVVLVDGRGAPLRPAIIWADQRSSVETEFIARVYGAEAVYRLTGQRSSATYTAPKLLWIKEHQPEIYRAAAKVIQVKDYAAFLLTGVIGTDYSDASGTQLYDIEGRHWADDLVSVLGLRRDLLPDIYPSTAVIGHVTSEAAEASGLVEGTPVVIGGADGACATVGAGAVEEGDVYSYVGSSSWIALAVRHPVVDPLQRTYTQGHLDPDLFYSIGTMQAGGGAFGWWERLMRGDRGDEPIYEQLDALAETVPPGVGGGLLFLPHLIGERSPYWDARARGAFIGLTMSYGRPELTRAALEGVAFNLRMILDALRGQGVRVDAMRVIGGGAKSAVWRQIMADMYDLPILLPALPASAGSLGAAIAGGVGVGLYPGLHVAKQLSPARPAETPNPAAVTRYSELYPLFQQAYRALEPIFYRLADLAGS